MRHHITPVIKPIVIKRTRKNKCQKGYGEKGTLVHCCGNVNSCSHYGRQYGSSKKLKLQLPYDPVIPLPGIDPKEMKTESKRDSYTPIYCSIIYNSLDMETTCMFINGRMGKEDGSTYVHIYMWNIYMYIYIYTHIYIMEYYHPSHERRESCLCDIMDRP